MFSFNVLNWGLTPVPAVPLTREHFLSAKNLFLIFLSRKNILQFHCEFSLLPRKLHNEDGIRNLCGSASIVLMRP